MPWVIFISNTLVFSHFYHVRSFIFTVRLFFLLQVDVAWCRIFQIVLVGTWGFGIGESIGEEGGGLRGEGVSGLGGVVGLREMWKKAEVEWV